ncbi:fad binding domain protein [Moniliophthora roreri]|nr:fad binding domain protein [Moniliophthora roreri]
MWSGIWLVREGVKAVKDDPPCTQGREWVIRRNSEKMVTSQDFREDERIRKFCIIAPDVDILQGFAPLES